MTLGRSTNAELAPQVWPRTPEGFCSCPYCTACREGRLDPVPDRPGMWLERMGGAGRSSAARAIWGER
jgi:hypothetical protein